LQVVDKAIVPDKKSGPHRALLTLAGMFLGFIAGVFWVILSAALKNLKSLKRTNVVSAHSDVAAATRPKTQRENYTVP
jgi:hypothetical protein